MLYFQMVYTANRFFFGSYLKPQLPKKLTLFLLIFQTIIKFIMEKEDLSYFRASIFFQSSRVSAATSLIVLGSLCQT